MKLFLFGLLISYLSFSNAFALQTPPVGFKEMLTTLSAAKFPTDIEGLTFVLNKPKDLENFELSLTPMQAFDITDKGDGRVMVNIVRSDLLINIDLYLHTGIMSLGEIGIEWKGHDVIDPYAVGGGFQSCSLNVGFDINSAIVSKATLDYFKSHNYSIVLDYDRNIFDFVKNVKNEFIFSRKNNKRGDISLLVYNPDGSLMAKSTVPNLALCEQPETTPRWNNWSEWNTCSVSCGGGIQSRIRTCATENLGLPCIGNKYEEKTCNIQSCLPELPAKNYFSQVAKNATWSRVPYTNASFKAVYAFSYQNTHPSKKLLCQVNINGVSIFDQEVTAALSTREYNFILAPGEQTTLRGELIVRLLSEGTHTGLRDNFVCQYR